MRYLNLRDLRILTFPPRVTPCDDGESLASRQGRLSMTTIRVIIDMELQDGLRFGTYSIDVIQTIEMPVRRNATEHSRQVPDPKRTGPMSSLPVRLLDERIILSYRLGINFLPSYQHERPSRDYASGVLPRGQYNQNRDAKH